MIAATICQISSAETLDWTKIRHWTGEGDNRSALVVQWYTEDALANPGAVVWGYRWDGSDVPTVDEMVREIAAASSDFCVLIQNTGSMGYTFDGAGYAGEVGKIIDKLIYDFDSAIDDENITFNYYNASSSMGQTQAPGDETPVIIANAISQAKVSHVIIHPLNYVEYGYPAYDYDWWQLKEPEEDQYWNSGWYKGYWSFWSGDTDMENLFYSGMGMSSVTLTDGGVYGWHYNLLDPDNGGGFGEDDCDWLPLNYNHFFTNTSLAGVNTEESADAEYYRPDGSRVYGSLSSGFYVVKTGSHAKKIFVK